MNYFNFFSGVRTKKKSVNMTLIALIAVLVTVAVIGGIFLFLKMQIPALNHKLTTLKGVSQDPVYQTRYTMETDLQKTLSDTENDYLFLRCADLLLTDGSPVSDTTVRDLISCFPKGTKIIRIGINQNSVTLECVADSLNGMIAAERNLQNFRGFSDVFISSVRKDSHADQNGENAVTFSVSLSAVNTESGAK